MIPFVSQRSVAQRVSVTLLEVRRGRILRAYRFNGLWDKKMIEYEGKARDLEEAMKERHAQAPRSAPDPSATCRFALCQCLPPTCLH